MKRSIRGILLATLATLAACAMPTANGDGTDNGSHERTLEIIENGELQARYALDANDKILKSESLGNFDVWTTRVYAYDSNGDIESIQETYAGSEYANTKSFSTSRSLGRSGRIEGMVVSIHEGSTVPSRAGRSSDRAFSYSYDESHRLESIAKVDGFGNREVKVARSFAEPASEGDITQAKAAGSSITDIPAGSLAPSGRSPSGGIEGTYMEIGADIHDFRPLGLGRTFSRAGKDITAPADRLTEGSIFIDEGGIARKVLGITLNGSTTTYQTTRPNLSEFMTDFDIPSYTYTQDDLEVRPEYAPDVVMTGPDGSARNFGAGLTGGVTLSLVKDLSGTKGDFVGQGELSLSVTPTVSFALDFGCQAGKWKWAKFKKGSGHAIIRSTLGVNANARLFYKGRVEHKFLIYPQMAQTDSIGFSCGLYMIPSIEGQLDVNAGLKYSYSTAAGVTWQMYPFYIPGDFGRATGNSSASEWSYSFSAKANIEAELRLLAIGGEMTLFGVTLFETFPGVGIYAEFEGSTGVSATYSGGKRTKYAASASGSGEVGFFLEGSISVFNDWWDWKLFELKVPFKTW